MKKQKEKTKTKNTKSNIIIILLIIAILLSSIFGYYAYSKYTSKLIGNSASTIAKWGFKVNGATQQFATINLEDTMTAVNNIIPDRVAPGTKGAMLLELDATECEVAVDYTITIDVAQKPTNLKMYESYTDGVYSEEIVPENGIMTITGTITLDQVSTIQNKYIYWQWPYETGTTENEIKENDKTDTIDSSKGSIVLPVTVTAVQRDPSSSATVGDVRLADVVSVGDYVNYDPTATRARAGQSYTTYQSENGSKDQTFTVNEGMKWKVMSVDAETGKVELMAENPTSEYLYLYGKEGYKNAETILNEIGALYGNGYGAEGGRSITVEDVNKLENYTPDDSWQSYTYTSGTFINEDGTETYIEKYSGDEITLSCTPNTAEKSTNGYYYYQTTNFKNKNFWLASRCINLFSDGCNFDVRNVYSGYVNSNYLFCSNGDESGNGNRYYSVLPVVSLQSNIQISGQDASGAWNLK